MFKKLWNWIVKQSVVPIQPLTVQETFNKVIELGYYRDIGNMSDSWMCQALQRAYDLKKITNEERHAAVIEILAYLDNHTFLRTLLRSKGLPDDFNSRLAIYKD